MSDIDYSKVPKWLRPTGKDFSKRDLTELDAREEAAKEGDGNVIIYDVARSRPPHRWKIYKRVQRRLKEMEELHEWCRDREKKELETGEKNLDNLLDKLDSSLNSMVE